jgi:DNA-binding transcriptional LysR family regulator
VLDADELVIIAALRGMGLAWANEWVVAPRVATGEVVTVLDDWSPPSPGLCLYYPAHQRSAALGAFADFVRARSPVAAVPPRGRTTVRRSSRRARGSRRR